MTLRRSWIAAFALALVAVFGVAAAAAAPAPDHVAQKRFGPG